MTEKDILKAAKKIGLDVADVNKVSLIHLSSTYDDTQNVLLFEDVPGQGE